MTAPLVEEATVLLALNGETALQWRCTPTDLEALAIGRLFIEGVIAGADQARVIVERNSEDVITVSVRTTQPALSAPRTAAGLPIPGPEGFADLFRALFNTVDARHEHGGMHAAAATDGQRIVVQLEDVGRHNTIDKITGALLLQGRSPAEFGLLTSSRVSGEIAHKAVRAGFAWLASRSIPTSLAVRFACEGHMPIIGRAAGRSAYIYP